MVPFTHLEVNNLFCKSQHGFCSRNQTNGQLDELPEGLVQFPIIPIHSTLPNSFDPLHIFKYWLICGSYEWKKKVRSFKFLLRRVTPVTPIFSIRRYTGKIYKSVVFGMIKSG